LVITPTRKHSKLLFRLLLEKDHAMLKAQDSIHGVEDEVQNPGEMQSGINLGRDLLDNPHFGRFLGKLPIQLPDDALVLGNLLADVHLLIDFSEGNALVGILYRGLDFVDVSRLEFENTRHPCHGRDRLDPHIHGIEHGTTGLRVVILKF